MEVVSIFRRLQGCINVNLLIFAASLKSCRYTIRRATSALYAASVQSCKDVYSSLEVVILCPWPVNPSKVKTVRVLGPLSNVLCQWRFLGPINGYGMLRSTMQSITDFV
jgi:hypothetical protein